MKIKDFKQFSELEEYPLKHEIFWSVRIALWGMAEPSLDSTTQERPIFWNIT